VENGYLEKLQRRTARRVSERGDLLHPGRRPTEAASVAAGLRPPPPALTLADRTAAEFAASCSGGKDGGEAALENAARFPLSHCMATTGIIGKNNYPSTQLLEALT
jgi:hypothetical protein